MASPSTANAAPSGPLTALASTVGVPLAITLTASPPGLTNVLPSITGAAEPDDATPPYSLLKLSFSIVNPPLPPAFTAVLA